MQFSLDLIGVLDYELKKCGFRDSGPVAGSMGRLYSRNGKRVVTIGPLKIPNKLVRKLRTHPGVRSSIDWPQVTDAVLHELLKSLQVVADEGNTPCDIVLPVGGTIPIPEWFNQAVEELGFSFVFICDGDESQVCDREQAGNSRCTTIRGYIESQLE